jgi:hypothetical protein
MRIYFQKSRAEAILEKSRQNKANASTSQVNHGSGTTDVLEKAKTWDLEIWSLNKLFIWLEKFKSRTRLPIKRMYEPHMVLYYRGVKGKNISNKKLVGTLLFLILKRHVFFR